MIAILCTGGTFDKRYGSGSGVRDFSFGNTSAVTEIVNRFGIENVEVTYDSEVAKDSLDITDEERYHMALWCRECPHDACVIVHGTDTMIDTARVIAQNNTTNKVVVLTGALRPACMRDSDAELNLGGALIAAQTCRPGVYIVMGGTIFRWDACRKNPTTGHFEHL